MDQVLNLLEICLEHTLERKSDNYDNDANIFFSSLKESKVRTS